MANKVLGFRIDIQGTDATRDLVVETERVGKAIRELNKINRETGKLNKAQAAELIKLKAQRKELTSRVNQQVKAAQAELDVTEDSVGAYRRMSAQLISARNSYKDLAAAGKANTKEAKQFLEVSKQLDEELKDIDASVGQFQRNVGDYKNAIIGAIPALSQFTDGLDQIKKETSAVGKAIATSFLIFEVINQLIQGAQAIREFTEEFRAFRGELSLVTGAANEELDELTVKSRALADTYKEDAKEIALAANVLSKEFNIGLGAALDKIEIGFRAGANSSGELLQNVREYASQTDNLDQLLNILIRSRQEGIYSDKGIDAVKEFNLSVREQTTATQEALEGAFGKKFTAELFEGINNGTITYTEALKLVSNGLNDTALTAEQTGTVIADVFRGPGEDAGLRFLQLLGDIDNELIDAIDSTDAYTQQQEELYQANLELNEAQNEVSKALAGSSAEFDIISTKVKTFLFQEGANLLRFVDEFPATVEGFRAGLEAIGLNIVGFFNRNFKRLEIFAAKAKRFAAGAVGADTSSTTGQIEALQAELKVLETIGGDAGEAYREAFLKKLKEIRGANEVAEAIAGQRTTEAVKKQAVKAVKSVNEEVAKEEEKAREAQGKANKAEAERILLQAQLTTQAFKTLAGGSVEAVDTLATDGTKSYQLIIDKSKELETVTKSLAQTYKDSQDELLDSDLFKSRVIAALVEVGIASVDIISQAVDIAAQKEIEAYDDRIQRSQGIIQQLEQEAATATGIRRQELNKRLQAQRQFLAAEEAQKAEAEKKAAKRAKAIAIIQSIINTALSVVSALKNPPGPPFSIPQAIAAGVIGAAQTALIAAQPVAAGGVIKQLNQAGAGSVRPVELPDSGGRVVSVQNIPTTRRGDKVLAAVKPGELFLNNVQQARARAMYGGDIFQNIGIPGLASGGLAGAPLPAPAVAGVSISRSGADVVEAVKALDRKTDAINGRIDRVRVFVVSDDVAEDLADGAALEAEATLE